MNRLSSYAAAAALIIGSGFLVTSSLPAFAQSTDEQTESGTTAHPNRISGTITAVHGHLVTIQQSRGTIVINDQPALNAKTTGQVTVGRQIVAQGHWQDGTFYATALQFPAAATADAAMNGADRVTGTITSVSGHLVTLQQSRGTLVINDQPALDANATGQVAVGRPVVAIGYWRAGTFYATALQFGLKPAQMHEMDSVSGTITSVSGHLVTLQQSRGTLVINDQAALDQKATGSVAVGRQVVASGYWQHGTFYASTINDATAPTEAPSASPTETPATP
ncbi:MAG: hypothetical protein M3R35_07010 [Candidatus Eremiobacteraeota bacterium]|nr:hypothetical protein [Candidatus Eremiobacteraeota bacterium]